MTGKRKKGGSQPYTLVQTACLYLLPLSFYKQPNSTQLIQFRQRFFTAIFKDFVITSDEIKSDISSFHSIYLGTLSIQSRKKKWKIYVFLEVIEVWPIYDVIALSGKLLVVEQIRWHQPERRDAALHIGTNRLSLSFIVLDLQATKVYMHFSVFGGKFENRLT